VPPRPPPLERRTHVGAANGTARRHVRHLLLLSAAGACIVAPMPAAVPFTVQRVAPHEAGLFDAMLTVFGEAFEDAGTYGDKRRGAASPPR